MSETRPTEFRIGRHMMSMWVPQAIHAAAELGIADLLAEGPLPAAEIAARLDIHADATARLLSALSVLEIVEATPRGWALAPRGAVFDLEHARAGALDAFARRGLGERATFVSGNFFEEPPPPADLFLLKSVLHDWSDERSLLILEKIRGTMGEDDRLVVIEPPAPEPDAEVPPSVRWVIAFSDLNMLVNTGGMERSAGAYRALLERGGFRLVDVANAGFYACFVCRKA